MLRRCAMATFLLLFVALLAHRIWQYAAFVDNRHRMPEVIADDEERTLFQSPGGKYSLADIAANGNLLPSEKYRSFLATHNLQPRPGDRLCPITRTKANPECTWQIDGRTYEFCCPPCIAEFVREAKQRPDRILPPEMYVARIP